MSKSRMRIVRDWMGCGPSEMAKKLEPILGRGVSKQAVSFQERETVLPARHWAEAYAKLSGVPSWWLMEEDKQHKDSVEAAENKRKKIKAMLIESGCSILLVEKIHQFLVVDSFLGNDEEGKR